MTGSVILLLGKKKKVNNGEKLPGTELLPDDLMPFKSIDVVVDENETVLFFNFLDILKMTPYNPRLKIGSLFIMLCYLNAPRLFNGTRLAIKTITGNLLKATIWIVKFKGEIVLLPLIPLLPSESAIPFERLQFPIH
ncbi:ATP-dependent DNA helicase [Trichonephila clavipes]|nr:ATP-dependent DNA helicase [Trichonephila clavipes]